MRFLWATALLLQLQWEREEVSGVTQAQGWVN